MATDWTAGMSKKDIELLSGIGQSLAGKITRVPTAPNKGNNRPTTQTQQSPGVDPNAAALAAERRAIARENAARKRAANRFDQQAATLKKQADALRKALNGGYKGALDVRLANIDLRLRQQDEQLLAGYEDRFGSLEEARESNVKAESDSTYQNLANRARERANAMSEAALQGAGESDTLRSHLMSLRNWNANQSEINRSFFDTLNSVNASLTDLNLDTRNARLNVESQALSDQEQSWTQYYNQMSDSYTQLGNVEGQRADAFGAAAESWGTKSRKSNQKKAASASGSAFNKAADFATTAWENPGNSQELLDWRGEDQFAGNISNTILSGDAEIGEKQKAPSGASLRSW